jgi:hypothetical protein
MNNHHNHQNRDHFLHQALHKINYARGIAHAQINQHFSQMQSLAQYTNFKHAHDMAHEQMDQRYNRMQAQLYEHGSIMDMREEPNDFLQNYTADHAMDDYEEHMKTVASHTLASLKHDKFQQEEFEEYREAGTQQKLRRMSGRTPQMREIMNVGHGRYSHANTTSRESQNATDEHPQMDGCFSGDLGFKSRKY